MRNVVVLSINESLATIVVQAPYSFTLNSQLTLSGGVTVTTPISPSITTTFAGVLTLINSASVGSSNIGNQGVIQFTNQASAASSSITNLNAAAHLVFNNSSTAAQAVISNLGVVTFSGSATADQASISQNGGTINFSGMTSPITVGALFGNTAAPGSINLGATSLAVGSLNTTAMLPDTISGNGGSLSKVGTGTLHLAGSNTYTGPTAVHNGILDVTGSVIGMVIVDAGATLTGSGSVGSTTNAGTLVPSGMLTINGSLIDSAPAITNLSVNATGNSGVLFVTGAATLDGLLHISFPGGPLPQGTTYVLLDSSGIVGAFATCTTDLPGIGTLAYSSTQITFTTPPTEHIFGDGFETPLCN